MHEMVHKKTHCIRNEIKEVRKELKKQMNLMTTKGLQ